MTGSLFGPGPADPASGALRLAAKLPRLGAHRDAIRRGWEALQRPAFYEQLGRDPDALVLAGVEALRERYGAGAPKA